jgi:hypothetical protein
MTTRANELLVYGLNIRAYDPKGRVWNMKWLDALAGTWTELGSEELGGVVIHETGITYRIVEPTAGHRFTRATYTNISAGGFTWRGERSNDGKTWEEFLVVELTSS